MENEINDTVTTVDYTDSIKDAALRGATAALVGLVVTTAVPFLVGKAVVAVKTRRQNKLQEATIV